MIFFKKLGGRFNTTGNDVASFDIASRSWSSVGSSAINKNVNAVVSDGTRVYIGGTFTLVGAATASCAATWNIITQTWDSKIKISIEFFSNPFVSFFSFKKSNGRWY